MSSPILFQVRGSSLLHRLQTGSPSGNETLDDVPTSYLVQLRDKGIDILYLLGVWTTGPYGDWHSKKLQSDTESPAEAESSPFAIFEYTVAAELGGDAAMHRFHKRCNRLGLRLMLDFVPNHLAADHPISTAKPLCVLRHSQMLVPVSDPDGSISRGTSTITDTRWFQPEDLSAGFEGEAPARGRRAMRASQGTNSGLDSSAPADEPQQAKQGVLLAPFLGEHGEKHLLQGLDERSRHPIAHGSEGSTHDAWEDTLQLNYFNSDLRRRMLRVLLKIACFGEDGVGLADGVRCDMAMLQLNARFLRAWGEHAPSRLVTADLDGQLLRCDRMEVAEQRDGIRQKSAVVRALAPEEASNLLAAMRSTCSAGDESLEHATSGYPSPSSPGCSLGCSPGSVSGVGWEAVSKAEQVLRWQQLVARLAADAVLARRPAISSGGHPDQNDEDTKLEQLGEQLDEYPWWAQVAGRVAFTLSEVLEMQSKTSSRSSQASMVLAARKEGFEVLAEFWPVAIACVREARRVANQRALLVPGEQMPRHSFIFMAESYGDTGYTLQRCGFDTTYDKDGLYDGLRAAIGGERDARDHEGRKASLRVLQHVRDADARYSLRVARMLENHDEERAAVAFGGPVVELGTPGEDGVAACQSHTPHMAALGVTFLAASGLRFLHDGQADGRAFKHGMHEGGARRPEPGNSLSSGVYASMLQAASCPELKHGYRTFLPVVSDATAEGDAGGGTEADVSSRVLAVLAWARVEQKMDPGVLREGDTRGSMLLDERRVGMKMKMKMDTKMKTEGMPVPLPEPSGTRVDSSTSAVLVLVNLSAAPAAFFVDWRSATYEIEEIDEDGEADSCHDFGARGADGTMGPYTRASDLAAPDVSSLPVCRGEWPIASCDIFSRGPRPVVRKGGPISSMLAPSGLGYAAVLRAAADRRLTVKMEEMLRLPSCVRYHGGGVSTVEYLPGMAFERPAATLLCEDPREGMWVSMKPWQVHALRVIIGRGDGLLTPTVRGAQDSRGREDQLFS